MFRANNILSKKITSSQAMDKFAFRIANSRLEVLNMAPEVGLEPTTQ